MIVDPGKPLASRRVFGRTIVERSRIVVVVACTMASGSLFAGCSRGVAEKPGSTSERTGSTSSALNASPQITDFLLYGQRSVRLGAHDIVSGGDVGVAAAAASTFGSQLVVGDHSQVNPTNNLLSPSTTLSANASVGDVQTNGLTNNGGTYHTLAPYPFSLPAVPLARPSHTGGADVAVASGQTLTLGAGAYGNLTVADHGSLQLGPGTFYFSNVALGEHSQLSGSAAGVTVQVAGTFSAAGWTSIASQALTAQALLIEIAGPDGSSTSAASLAAHDQVTALIAVPHGTLSLADHVQVTGALAAFDIVAGDYLQATYADGFSSDVAYPHGQQVISGEVPAGILAGRLPVVGPVPDNVPITLAIGLPLRNQADLDAFIDHLYDPTRPEFHQYIQPVDFADHYGALQGDYDAVVGFARSSGFDVLRTYPSRYLVTVRAPAAVVEDAFFVSLLTYQRNDGSTFYAPANDISVNLSNSILHVSGFDSYGLSSPADGSGDLSCQQGVRDYAGYDYRHAYLPCLADPVASPNAVGQGAGQTIALVAEDGILTEAVTTYANTFLNGITPNVVAVPVPSGSAITPHSLKSAGEVAEDIQMLISMAPKAKIKVYEEDPFTTGSYAINHDEIFAQIAADNDAKVITSSFEWSASVTDPITPIAFEEFAAQGQSFFQSSGDGGAYVGSGGVEPRSPMIDTTLITVVGGTSLTTAGPVCGLGITPCALPASYPKNYFTSEVTWFDVGMNINGSTGGGFATGHVDPFTSFNYPTLKLPNFQSSLTPWVTTTNPDFATNTNNARMLPDVAAVATHMELVQMNDTCSPASGPTAQCNYTVGSAHASTCLSGTSLSTPLWAGVAALVNEKFGTTGTLGFANPELYRIAFTQSLYDSDFNDVTSGNNDFSCAPNCTAPITYNAYTGYDLATGLGTPTCALMNQLVAGVSCSPTGSPVNLDTDPKNCGACNVACKAGQSCCGGTCVSEQTDIDNCGKCGTACGGSQPCCSAGACVDVATNAENCGTCGNACATGATCSSGLCGCPAGKVLCGDACVDEQTDAKNCGSCGLACGSGTACCGGSCANTTSNCGTCGTSCPSGDSCCNNGCTNTQTDKANCGQCGRSCLGGTCATGTCGAVTLASSQGFVRDVVVGGGAVCWDNDEETGLNPVPGVVKCLSTATSSASPLVVSSESTQEASGLAIDSSAVYFAVNERGGLGLLSQAPMFAANDETPLFTLTPVASNTTVLGVARNAGGSVYFGAGGDILSVPVDGGTVTTLVSGSAPTSSGSMAADLNNVYWVSDHVFSVPTLGGLVTTLASASSGAGGLAVDRSNVYWTDLSSSTVQKVPIGGSTVVTMTKAQSSTQLAGIAVDSSGIYFASYGSSSGAVLKVPLLGGAPTTLATGTRPYGIALDTVSVYWTDSFAGTVMRIAK